MQLTLETFPQSIIEAAERIAPYLRETPTEASPEIGPKAHLKLENFQVTGSFKARGALNKLLCLDEAVRKRGIVVASTGNHGAASAYGAERLGCPCKVFAPEGTDPSKLTAIRSRGAELILEGNDCLDSELQARSYAEAEGLTYISPYNDLEVAAGQGSVGVELERQVSGLQRVYVAVGGGGLIAGVGGHLKNALGEVEVVGCCPELSDVMARSVPTGHIVDVPYVETLSDGTAGSLEQGSVTLPLCTRYVDRFELVTEEEIADSVRFVLEQHRMLIEGAAGVAVAVARRELRENPDCCAAVVLCGANISPAKLKKIL